MKIGIDCRFWNESGVGRYVSSLVKQLLIIDRKNNYVLFVRSENLEKIKNQISTLKAVSNLKIVIADIRWHSISEQILFPHLIDKEELDLMHFPYFSVPLFYSRPFVVTIHDLILHHFATGEATTKPKIVYWMKLAGYKLVMQRTAERAKKIITVSQSTKRDIVEELGVPQDKIAVTYEGVDEILSKNIEKPVKEIDLKKYLLHVGNLYPHKNMDVVLLALKMIKDKKDMKIQLVIAGKKDYFYFRFKKRVFEMDLENQVVFLGEVNDAQLRFLYQNALFYISPSLLEGFDLPVVEAMSQNCLCVISDIPVHREICKNGAIYFESTDSEGLALKLSEIYVNGISKYREEVSSAKSIASEFDWENMARETLRIYHEKTNSPDKP